MEVRDISAVVRTQHIAWSTGLTDIGTSFESRTEFDEKSVSPLKPCHGVFVGYLEVLLHCFWA